MTTGCPDCKDGILNKQGSLFADPACTDCGTTEVVCTGKSTYSDCVEVNQAFECIGSDNGDSLTQVLSDINTKLCTAFETTNTILVSSDDTCAGYLSDKIASSDFELSVTNDGGGGRNCETLNINEKCFTYIDVLNASGNSPINGQFSSNFRNYLNYQKLQYSKKSCSVKIRGVVSNFGNVSLGNTVFTLPIGFRPNSLRFFPTSLRFLSGGVTSGILGIATDGKVFLDFSTGTTINSNNIVYFPIEIEFDI